ncbi:restriction endonuclease subunit S [Paenibacillus sp.]|uniref:restriction endonuclease subunit S n=1 Tax=Paenibacillus sp. TaxID=58172 RepID=UPI0028B26257|nr:restriction endonuclease subunit S [Paenibacillus sp.]
MSKNNAKTAEELLQEALVPEEEQPYKVPDNWSVVKLKTVCAYIQRGKSPKYADDMQEIPVISQKCVQWSGFDISKARFIDPNTLNSYQPERFLQDYDILWNSTGEGTIGRVALYRTKATNHKIVVADSHVTIVRSDKRVLDPRFLFYWLSSPYIQKYSISRSVSGTTKQTELSTSAIKEMLCFLPPLFEQKRITGKVEVLLNKINQAKQLIEEAKETFELRRAAILDKAFRGELTANFREKSSFVKENTSIEKSHVSMFEIPNEWRWVEAGVLFSSFPRNGFSPKSTGESSHVKTLKLGAITKGYFKKEEFKFIDEDIKPDSYLWLKTGDFLIQRANSIEYVGTAAIYTGPDDDCIYPDLIMKGKVDETIILPQYLVFWINSSFGKNYIRENATGTAGNMPKINQKVVKGFPVPLPSISEQKVILVTLEKINDNEKNIIQSIEEIESKLEALTKGILTNAFSGDLGTTDLENETSIELLRECLFGSL